MKKVVLSILSIFLKSLLLLSLVYSCSSNFSEIARGKRPGFQANFVTANPFDFQLQSRKTTRDSDVWIRSEEGFNTGMQGIEPLWARIYGGDEHDDLAFLQIDSDNGCVVSKTDWEHYYTTLFKLSDKGLFEWKINYQITPSITAFFHNIESCADGGYICTGKSHEPGIGQDGIVIKFSSDWTVEWAYKFGAVYVDHGIAVTQTNDQGYLIAGRTLSFLGSYPEQIDDFSFDLLLVKISANGDIEKQFSIGGPGDESYNRSGAVNRNASITVKDTKYGYLLACDSESFGSRRQIWMFMIDHAFNKVLWQKTYGGKEDEYLNSNGSNFQITPDKEGAIVACFTLSYGVANYSTNTRSADAWIFKVNLADGKLEWQKTYGGEGADWANCIQPTLDGNYIVLGGTTSFSANSNLDIWSFIIDQNGKLIRENAFGTELYDVGRSIVQSSNKEFFIGGETRPSYEESEQNILPLNIILFKVDSDLTLYPDCGLSRESNAIVDDTYAIPSDTYEILWPTTASYWEVEISTSDDRYLSTNLLCWNLNQPPVNVHFERAENKSFFVSEAWHTITWDPDPYNSDNGFDISEYKIYRKERDDADDKYSSFQQIGTVPGYMSIFVDKNIQPDKQYQYAVISVDSEGNESPKSESVGNVS